MQIFFTPIGEETFSLLAYCKKKINDYIAPTLSV